MRYTYRHEPTWKRASILLYFDALFVLASAGNALVISADTNPHSAMWLLAMYLSLGLLFAAVRRWNEGTLWRALTVYLLALSEYLFVIWLVHIYVPWPDRCKQTALNAELSQTVEFWVRVFCVG